MKTNVFMFVLVLLMGFSMSAQAFETYDSPTTSSASSASRAADNGGHPFVSYKNREALTELFRDVESDGSQDQFVTVANRSFSGSYNTYAEVKRYMLSSNDIDVVRCTTAIGGDEIPVETYYNDGRFDSIIRRGCYDGEYLVLENGHPVLSLRCGNGIAIPRPKPEPETPTVRRSSCGAYKSARATGTNTTAQKVNSFHVDFKYSHTNINYIQENGVSCN